ncbi:MAG TPA: DUF1127 domain-containing protein [Reyranella sp.]|nr:DUF1127 domain-containing protein [Reyranella sp.]
MTVLRSAVYQHQRSIDAVFTAAFELALAVQHRWRQMLETRRARRHLLQLDDYLLRDIGLTRADVRFGDFETLSQHRRSVGFR